MTSREIADKEIESWIKGDIFYQNYFKFKKINGLVGLCVIVTQFLPSREKVIERFIGGLALYGDYLITNDEQDLEIIEKLTRPVLDMAIYTVKSKSYQKLIIKKEISGDETIHTKQIITPISHRALRLYSKNNNIVLFTQKDVRELRKNFIESIDIENKGTAHIENEKQKSKLTLEQIALLYAYSGKTIDKKNCDEIAGRYGRKAGHKLYQFYLKYLRQNERTGIEPGGTILPTKNKAKNIETVISHLPEDKMKRAESELITLNKLIENETYKK